MDKFKVIDIPIPKYQRGDEIGGGLEKGWVDLPETGKALYKSADASYAKSEQQRVDWAEKVNSEIGSMVKLPTAKYELASLIGTDDHKLRVAGENKLDGSLSEDMSHPNDVKRISLEEVYEVASSSNVHNVKNALDTLDRNNVGLPPDWQVPAGIKNGADMLVGIILQDALTSNRDRHAQNIEVVQTDQNTYYLSPNFDNGVSLGADMTPRQRDAPLSDPSYHVSYFNRGREDNGDYLSNIEAFKEAVKERPRAAKIWLTEFAKLDAKKLKNLIEQVPSERITDNSRNFAKKMIAYNHAQIKSLAKQMATSRSSVRFGLVQSILRGAGVKPQSKRTNLKSSVSATQSSEQRTEPAPMVGKEMLKRSPLDNISPSKQKTEPIGKRTNLKSSVSATQSSEQKTKEAMFDIVGDNLQTISSKQNIRLFANLKNPIEVGDPSRAKTKILKKKNLER